MAAFWPFAIDTMFVAGSARPAEEEPGSCWGLSRALGALPMVTSSVGGAEDAPSAGQLFRQVNKRVL